MGSSTAEDEPRAQATDQQWIAAPGKNECAVAAGRADEPLALQFTDHDGAKIGAAGANAAKATDHERHANNPLFTLRKKPRAGRGDFQTIRRSEGATRELTFPNSARSGRNRCRGAVAQRCAASGDETPNVPEPAGGFGGCSLSNIDANSLIG